MQSLWNSVGVHQKNLKYNFHVIYLFHIKVPIQKNQSQLVIHIPEHTYLMMPYFNS